MAFTLQGLKSLRLAGAVLLIASLAAAGALYGIFVVEQRQYLVSRNFRLLNTTASQTENSIRAVGGIFERLFKENTPVDEAAHDEPGAAAGDGTAASRSGAGVTREPQWLKNLKADVPVLRQVDWSGLPDKLPRASKVESTYRWIWKADERLQLSLHWDKNPIPMNIRLKLDLILDPIFKPRIDQRVFDTLALATADGRVLYAKGGRQQELQSSSLDALVGRARGKTPPVDFKQLARTSAVEEVEIAGARYFLFLQPCCRSLAWADAESGPNADAGTIVVGLADAGALSTRSYAISTSWIKLATGAVLLALVGWPFLKLWLIGERKRVRVVDVVQLGASSVFGVALLTIFMLDGYASWRTDRDVDIQLEQLAEALKENVTAEVLAASRQLECAETLALGTARGGATKEGDILTKDWFKCPGTGGDPGAPTPYPFFESFALIDADGQQQLKWAANSHVSSKVRVADRDYFRRARDGHVWDAPDLCPGGCFVESIWSWTSGKQQAVLSKPSEEKKVVALSIPMRSLMGTTLAPGFEFAVVDAVGTVLFHSDPQRNTFENLFQETDQSRRLRASVAAHNAEPLNVRYWGRPYRAFVLPFDRTGWSIVTLFDKQRLGTLGLEWLAVTLVFLSTYMVLWGTVMFIGLSPGAAWVWPDERRRRQYVAVALVVIGAMVVFVLAMRNYHGGALLAWAYGIPIATWLVTYFVLKLAPGPAALRPLPEPLVEFSVAATLLLIVTAVFPAIAFFLTSYEVHAESYVKQTQVRVAEALGERWRTLREEYSEDRGKGKGTIALQATNEMDDIDTYYRFFYNTTVGSIESTTPKPSWKHAPGENWLLSLFEEYLPYYAEASVEWRQLLHHRAHDRSWFSIPTEEGQTLVVTRYNLVVHSTLPALFGAASMRHEDESHSRQEESEVARVSLGTPADAAEASTESGSDGDDKGHASIAPFVMPLMPLAVGVLACGIVAFILRHVFLAGLSEPLWARLRLSASAGDNLFVLCDAAVKATQIQGTSPLKLGPIAATPDVEAQWRAVLLELDQREPSRAVLIDDFDDDLQNAQIMNRKLALLEELVADPERIVVVLSQLPTAALANSLSATAIGGTGLSPRDRWKRLLTTFSKIDWRGLGSGAPVIAELSENPQNVETWGRRTVRGLHSLQANLWNRRRRMTATLNEEAESDPFVRRVCLDIADSPFLKEGRVTRDQILDEIGERSAGFYRHTWQSCSDDEKVVLVHIAQDGLANACSRRTVRRLLGRRLLRKDPRLRVMNTTFRWFLLSPERRAEVMRLEGDSDPGMWNRLRAPLSVGVAVTAVFLFVTQKELFDATVTVATTMTVALPVLLRTVGLVAGRQMTGHEDAPKA